MQPDDLSNLTRLMTLQSVAMLADIHADMPGTITGNRLEGQIRQLWDATEDMSETIGTAPLDSRVLLRVEEKYVDVQNAYLQLNSTLGELPGISNRASAHLQGFGRLTAATNSVMRAIDADLRAPVRLATTRKPNVERLREQARLFSNDVVGLDAKVKNLKQRDATSAALARDLDELFRSTQEFLRAVAPASSTEQIRSAFRPVQQNLARADARITKLSLPTDFTRNWRGMRNRLSAINDEIGLPRLIDRSIAVSANNSNVSEPDRATGLAHLPRKRVSG